MSRYLRWSLEGNCAMPETVNLLASGTLNSRIHAMHMHGLPRAWLQLEGDEDEEKG